MISNEAKQLIQKIKTAGHANIRISGVGPRYSWDVRASVNVGMLRLIVERTITTIPLQQEETLGQAIDHVFTVMRNNSATIAMPGKPSIVCAEASYVPSALISVARHTRAQLTWSCKELGASGLLVKKRGSMFGSTLVIGDKTLEFEVPAHRLDNHIEELRKQLPLVWHPVVFNRGPQSLEDQYTVDLLCHVYETGMQWRDVKLITNHSGDVEIWRDEQYIRTVSGTLDLGQEVFLWHGYTPPNQALTRSGAVRTFSAR